MCSPDLLFPRLNIPNSFHNVRWFLDPSPHGQHPLEGDVHTRVPGDLLCKGCIPVKYKMNSSLMKKSRYKADTCGLGAGRAFGRILVIAIYDLWYLHFYKEWRTMALSRGVLIGQHLEQLQLLSGRECRKECVLFYGKQDPRVPWNINETIQSS